MINRVFNNMISKVGFQFSSKNGPYNPFRFKQRVIQDFIRPKQVTDDIIASFDDWPGVPIRNLRHINPVRQSGPLPSYDGPYTMEDIRSVWLNTSAGRHGTFCVQMDPDEIMRRVPGITRREAEKITTLGLNPQEQVDYAYLVYNNGIDIDYVSNNVYVARQVVTNSKGEKVEILWNAQVVEDLAKLPTGFAPVNELTDYHWEIFLWADPMIKVTGDLDLGVPNTWFEYELEWSGEMVGVEDQFNLPESERIYPSPRHPNARKELWKSQDDLYQNKLMEDENWVPQTRLNLYQQNQFTKTERTQVSLQEDIKI